MKLQHISSIINLRSINSKVKSEYIENPTKVVVMGGHNTISTEILDVNSMKWKTGPRRPFSHYYDKGVQSEGGPYLGFSTGSPDFSGKIYGLKKQSEDSFEWEEVQSMTTGRDSLRFHRGQG